MREVDPRPIQDSPPISLPEWTLPVAVAISVIVAVAVAFQLSKTEYRLKIDEHRQIQQITATIAIVVGVAVAGFSTTVSQPLAISTAGVIGAVSVPSVQRVGGTLLADRRPRERLLLGWVGIWIIAIWLTIVDIGYAHRYLIGVAHVLVFVGVADSLALLRELSDYEWVSAESSEGDKSQ